MQITVNTQGQYTITIKQGAIAQLNERIKSVTKAKKVAIISDDKVFALYGEMVKNLLHEDFSVSTFVFTAGESSKNWQILGNILEFLAEEGLDRNDCLLALGGGVVGDITGLAAALYLRGIDYLAVPTTLLAQVDASVGGKTAIDLKAGKNLAGAFYQPKAVICDVNFLATLPQEEFACGMAEIIKYAIGFDKELYQMLLDGKENLEQIILRAIEIKRDIVQKDERDENMRQMLNLGHTFGHSVEVCSGFTLKHGAAVSIGLSLICRAFRCEFIEEVECLLRRYHLPTECPYAWSEIYRNMLADKKKRGDEIALIVPFEIGNCRIQRVSLQELEQLTKEACGK